MINARGEKLAESRFWKPMLEHGRCAIPADGFFEWRAAEAKGGRKQPYWFTRENTEGFALAGLWRAAKPTDGEAETRACVIVTVEPNDLVSGVHDRMPAMLKPESVDQWLGGDVDEALAALEPFPSTEMTARAVGTAVGNARAEGPELVEPLAEASSADAEQGLF
jgi:putative SOS response-associated peptidase YedK